MNKESTKLSLTINNTQSVELLDYSLGMISISAEYNKFIKRHMPEHEAQGVKLYISEVKKGSIVTELVVFGSVGIQFIAEHSDTILAYAKYLEHLLSKYLVRKPKEDIDAMPAEIEDKDTLSNIIKILEPNPLLFKRSKISTAISVVMLSP
jgi:hypothetical protein